MRDRLQWFIHLQAHGLRKGDEHPAYTPHGYDTLYLYPPRVGVDQILTYLPTYYNTVGERANEVSLNNAHRGILPADSRCELTCSRHRVVVLPRVIRDLRLTGINIGACALNTAWSRDSRATSFLARKAILSPGALKTGPEKKDHGYVITAMF